MKILVNKKKSKSLIKEGLNFQSMPALIKRFCSKSELILDFCCDASHPNTTALRSLGFSVVPFIVDDPNYIEPDSTRQPLFSYQYDVIFMDRQLNLLRHKKNLKKVLALVSDLLDTNGLFMANYFKPHDQHIRIRTMGKHLITHFHEVEIINNDWNEPVYFCQFPKHR